MELKHWKGEWPWTDSLQTVSEAPEGSCGLGTATERAYGVLPLTSPLVMSPPLSSVLHIRDPIYNSFEQRLLSLKSHQTLGLERAPLGKALGLKYPKPDENS